MNTHTESQSHKTNIFNIIRIPFIKEQTLLKRLKNHGRITQKNRCGKNTKITVDHFEINFFITKTCAKKTQEIQRLGVTPIPGVVATPHPDNLRYFDVTLNGPDGTPFGGKLSK